jgi:hypothetical protein
MKYLVNRETKEHRIYEYADGNKHYLPAEERPNNDDWMFVEADAEGWITNHYDTSPLSDESNCQIRNVDGTTSGIGRASDFYWRQVTSYRPILDNPVVKESLTAPAPDYDPRSVSFNLLKRLEAAHEAAQSIPELEAELRKVLGSMGYDLVARSPFVDATDTDVATMPDMSDWRNWQEGDLLECVSSSENLSKGGLYIIKSDGHGFYILDDEGDDCSVSIIEERFRFHSRPEKT